MYKWILQILEISLKKGFGRGNKKENFWDPKSGHSFRGFFYLPGAEWESQAVISPIEPAGLVQSASKVRPTTHVQHNNLADRFPEAHCDCSLQPNLPW